MKSIQYPFPGCPGTSHIRSGLKNHLTSIHWVDSILILEEDPKLFPHCERCVQQVTQRTLKNCHYKYEACLLGQERRRQRETLQRFFEVNWMTIRVNLNPIGATTAF